MPLTARDEDRLNKQSDHTVDQTSFLDIVMLLQRRVMDTPDSIAVEEGGCWVTAREVDQRANQWAHFFLDMGAQVEDLVVISLPRSIDLILLMVACLKAGVTYIPLDPSFPAARKVSVFRESQARWLITHDPVGLESALSVGQILTPAAFEERRDTYSRSSWKIGVDPDNLAYVIYTSGSTGSPKGVAITRRGLTNYLEWASRFYPTGDAGTPLFLSPAFDLCVTSILVPWLKNDVVVVYPGSNAFDELGKDISEGRSFSFLKMTSTHLRLLRDKLGREGPREEPCDSLIIGGEKLDGHLVDWWRNRWPNTHIFNEYGPTETVVGSMVYEVRETGKKKEVPIGRPVANTQVYLVDESMLLIRDPIEGELLIGGAGVARGYLARPDLTADKFVPDPFSARPGVRLYRTGDRAIVEDGVAHYHGRADRQVKIRGYRIELGEIECAIKSSSGVADAVVLPVKTRQGEGRVLAAFVTRGDDGKAATEQNGSFTERLRTALVKALPEFMVPLYISVVSMMPLMASGKLDHEALENQLSADTRQSPSYRPPRNPIEETLVLIWTQVLGVPQVGLDDNFFLLGGDSMRSLQVRYKAAQRGLQFELKDLFEARSVRKLAERVTGSDKSEYRIGAFELISNADRSLVPREVEDAYPLSRLQMGTLYHSSMPDRPGIYHNINSYRLQVRWDERAFRQVVDRLITRHAILRSAYDLSRFSEAVQMVYFTSSIPIAIIDMRGQDRPYQQAHLFKWLNEEAQNAFDWEQPPLLRFFVHRFDEDELQFSLSKHHSILDGWSAASMISELFNDYLATINGEICTIEPPVALYRDFIALECEALRSVTASEFWRTRLLDFSLLEIPKQEGQSPLPDFPTGSIATSEVPISEDMNAALNGIAAELGLPLKDVLLAAHIKMLSHLTGQRDIVTGLVSNGRPEAIESDRSLGLFLNSIPLRIRLGQPETWGRLVERVFEEEWQIFPYRRYPMLEMKRNLGVPMLFDTLFYFTNFHVFQQFNEKRHVKAISFAGFEETEMRFTSAFSVHPLSKRLKLSLHFRIGDFSTEQIETTTQRYEAILRDLALGIQQSHTRLPRLSESEFDLQCIAWNGCEEVGASWFGGVLSSIDLVPRDCVAVTCGSSSLSYGALLDRSARVAGWLREEGLAGSDRLIGVLVERTVESVVALLGVLQSGSAYVALPAEGPKERLEELIRVAELTSVLVSGEEVERRKLELGGLYRVIVVDERVQGARPWRGVVERDALAYVLFTSGSTGRPKGVMVSHGNLLASTQARQGYYGEAVERFLMLSPFFFDSSVAGLYWTLCSGGCVVLPEEGEQRDGARLAEICADESITHLLCIPGLYEVLLGSLNERSCLKVAIVAGEACGSKLVREHEAKLAGVRLCNEYGPTEGTVWSTVSCGEALGGGEGAVPIGRAVGTLRAYIEDEAGELLPVGAQGEIVVGGSGVARGYWKQPGATAEKFVADGLSGKAGQRCYRTGDKGRWSGDGQIVFEGRMDDEVKVRGHRVSLGEIESVLMRHEAVAEAAAVQQGEGGPLLAFAVLRPGREMEGAVLREYLRQYLPQAVVPGQIRMVTELPKLPNGKLNRHRLLVIAQEKVSQSLDREYMDPVESLIADVWREVLGRESVRSEDNFFEVGGHSLLATQVLNRMHSLFDRSVMLRTFFEHPTLRGLASEIKRAQLSSSLQSGSTAIRTRAACERSPLSFQQQRLWFLYEMDRFSTDYHLPRALRLRGKLSVEQIDRTLREIIRRHEVLRTTFTAEDGRPYMVVNKASAWQFSIQPIDGITADEKLKEIVLRINDEIRSPFVLEKEAFRFILYQIDNDDQVLFINMHHIVTDGWSLGLLMKELRILLTDFQHGRNNTLPELPFQYRDFAAWQREWLQGSVLDGYIDHWQRELKDAPTASQLPMREDTTRIPFAGRSLLSHTGPELADSLRKFCRDSGNTLYIVLESLFAVSVAWHSGVSDIVIGTSVANRRDPRSESLIGFFSNTIPIRTRIDPDCTYRSLFQRAKRTILRAFSLEDVPMESVVSRLRRSGALGRQEALFDTFFVLHNEPIQTLSIPGLHAEFVDIHNPTTMFKLSASVSEESDGLLCMLHYDANYLSEEMVLTIEKTFERLLAASVAAPDDLVFNTLADDPDAFIPHFSTV